MQCIILQCSAVKQSWQRPDPPVISAMHKKVGRSGNGRVQAGQGLASRRELCSCFTCFIATGLLLSLTQEHIFFLYISVR